MIEFAIEKYQVVQEEGDRGVFQLHWEELAIDKVIPWEINHELYTQMESNGMLHVATVRDAGRIVGYHIGIIAPHLHYKNAGLMCYEDMYFILKEYRVGGVGAQFFMFIEEELRKKGITKWFLSCKAHRDHSEVFKGLGFRLQDYGFTKLLNGAK